MRATFGKREGEGATKHVEKLVQLDFLPILRPSRRLVLHRRPAATTAEVEVIEQSFWDLP